MSRCQMLSTVLAMEQSSFWSQDLELFWEGLRYILALQLRSSMSSSYVDYMVKLIHFSNSSSLQASRSGRAGLEHSSRWSHGSPLPQPSTFDNT